MLKITKGVTSIIWPDDHMPVDEQGIRADIIQAPQSVFNRMNKGQLYEQFFNRAGSIMQKRVREGVYGNTNQTVEKVIDFFNDIRPKYAEHVKSMMKSNSDKERFLDAIEAEGIFFVIPPFCEHVNTAKVLEIAAKWDIKESPITYKQVQHDGSIQTFTTKSPACIGSKYIYLLGKIPLSQLSAIELGFTNQFGTPTKNDDKEIKSQCLFGRTPIRYGEDEVCIMTMSCGPDAIARMMGMISGSPRATNIMGKSLMSHPTPSNIEEIDVTTTEILQYNTNINIFDHMMAVIGYDVHEGKNEN